MLALGFTFFYPTYEEEFVNQLIFYTLGKAGIF